VQDAALPVNFMLMNPAAIGWDQTGVNITMNIGGTLTMAGGAMGLNAGSPVVIAGIEGIPATVAIGAGAFSSTSPGQFVTRIGTHGTGSVDISTTTGALGLGKSTVGVGSGAVILSSYGGITQDVLGRVSADVLVAEAGTGGTGNLSLPGVNRAGWVDLQAAGSIDYTSYKSFHLFEAKNIAATTVAIRTTSGSPYGGDIFINEAGYGGATTVTVTAYGGIYDDNGIGTTNITGNSMSLYSYGGNIGDMAISSDVDATSTIVAQVNAGSAYGGIYIRNTGASLPGTITLLDGAINQPSVRFEYGGDIALGAGHLFGAGTGDINITSGGAMSGIQTPRFSGTPANINLTAQSGNMSLTGAGLSSAGDISLSAVSGTLSIAQPVSAANLTLDGSTIDISAAVNASGDLAAAGSAVNVDSLVVAQNVALGANSLTIGPAGGIHATNHLLAIVTGDVNIMGGYIKTTNNDLEMLVGGDLNMGNASYGGWIYGGYTKMSPYFPDVSIAVGGDLKLNNGAYIGSANDVYIDLLGATSTLVLNDGTPGYAPSYILSDIGTGVIGTAHLTFLNRSSGGISIDGSDPDGVLPSTVVGGSGFFAVNTSTPAAPGAGLDITFAGGATNDTVAAQLVNALTSAIDDVAPDKTPTDSNAPPPTPDASGTGAGSGGPAAGAGGTGGTEGTFGAETGGTTGGTTGETAGGTGGSPGGTANGEGSGDTKTAAAGKDDKKDEKDKKDDKKPDQTKDGKKDGRPTAKKLAQCS
jgi:hypothetical protein